MLKQKLDMGDKTLKYRWLKTKFESIGKKKSLKIYLTALMKIKSITSKHVQEFSEIMERK